MESRIKHYQSIVNHNKALVYLFLPKCGGCSVCEYLQKLDDWDLPVKNPQHPNDTNILIPAGYKVFTVIREPVDWILSGYRMFAQRRNYTLSITEHLELIRNPLNTYTHLRYEREDWGDWWWHCGITPDKHFEKYKDVRVFKLENLDLLQKWLGYYFDTKDIVMPHTNQTEPQDIILSDYDKELIEEITYFYKRKYY